MNRAQFEVFRAFYSRTLEEGTAWFDIALPLGDVTPTCTARFVERYRAQPRQRAAWQVNAELELFPPAVDAALTLGLSEDWPEALPYESVAQPYSIDPHEPALRSEEDEGPAGKRRRFVDTPATFQVAWRFDFAGFALFLAWWRAVLRDGRRWAEIPLRLAEDFETCTCRFHGHTPWRASPWRGAYWLVTATLEVRRPPILSEAEMEAYAAAASLHQLVHVVLPDSLPA
jgi:hypothetical protein